VAWWRRKSNVIPVLLIIATILSNYYIHGISDSSLENRMATLIEEAGSLPDQEIHGWFEEYKDTIEISGQFILYNDWKEEEIKRYFADKIGVESNFLRLYFTDGEGTNIIYPEITLPDDFDPRIRDWYQQAIQSDEIVITGTYDGVTDDIRMITVAMAVSDFSGNFMGVIAGDIPVEAIQDKLISRSKNFMGGIIISGGQKDLLQAYHPEGLEAAHQEMLLLAQNQTIEGTSFESAAIEVLALEEGFFLASWMPVEDSPWRIFTYVPLGDVLGYSRANLLTMLEVILLLAGFASVMYLYVHRPTLRLVRAIEKVDIERDSGYRIQWKESWGFESLVHHLNYFLSLWEKSYLFMKNSLRRQNELTEENLMMETLFKSMPHGVVKLDNEGYILDYNEYFCTIFGVSPETIEGVHLSAVTGRNQTLPEAVPSEESHFEGIRYLASGEATEFRIHVLPVILAEGLVKTYVVYHRKKA